MPRPTPDAPRWSGRAGHYEVWYLTPTDVGSGVGLWIRHTMSAATTRRLPRSACTLYERAPRVGGWAHTGALEARFEYGQRTPVPGMELHLR